MKNKKVFNIIFCTIVVLMIFTLSFFATSLSSKKEESAGDIIERAQKESKLISEDKEAELNSISISEYMDMYNGDSNSLILVGRPTCDYCKIGEPIIRNLAYKYDFTVNYLDIDSIGDDGVSEFVKSNDYFSKGFGTPMLLIVKDKNIVDMVDGLADTKTYKEFLEKYEYIK